jgi:hypothetical protein
MLKPLIASSAFVLCFAAPALAQDATLPPVESMDCAAMQAELLVAGQQMNAQMDPEFAVEAQRMQEESQNARSQVAGNIAAGIGMGLACSIPGVSLACMAGQQAQMANAQRDAAENQARMDAQMGRLDAAMAGLDQERLMALSQRYEEQRCETPQ